MMSAYCRSTKAACMASYAECLVLLRCFVRQTVNGPLGYVDHFLICRTQAQLQARLLCLNLPSDETVG